MENTEIDSEIMLKNYNLIDQALRNVFSDPLKITEQNIDNIIERIKKEKTIKYISPW